MAVPVSRRPEAEPWAPALPALVLAQLQAGLRRPESNCRCCPTARCTPALAKAMAMATATTATRPPPINSGLRFVAAAGATTADAGGN